MHNTPCMSTAPQLGPVALCTLVARDGDALQSAYCNYLHQSVAAAETLDQSSARALGLASLAGAPTWLLANSYGRAWLLIVEAPQASSRQALGSLGWMAMETLVEDVDTLAEALQDSPFTVLRPAADLDISDKIRACQVQGPAGEILYLTQVRGAVPPFDLPKCRAPVDHLFIPVLSSPAREQSLAEYAALSGKDGLNFDTRITVVNQARGLPLETRHPVATLQLAGSAMLEIDELADTPAAPGSLSEGMAGVALYHAGKPPPDALRLDTGPLAPCHALARTGVAGERYTLVYRQGN